MSVIPESEDERHERSETGVSIAASAGCDNHKCNIGLNRRIIVALVSVAIGIVTSLGWLRAA